MIHVYKNNDIESALCKYDEQVQAPYLSGVPTPS
jgi:hypothetical protein